MLSNPKLRVAIVGLLMLAIGSLVVLPRLSTSEAAEPAIPADHNPGPTLALPGQVYHLRTADPLQLRYVKLRLVLEFVPDDPAFYVLTGDGLARAQEAFMAEMTPRLPIIRDAVTTAISTLALDDLRGAFGRDVLKATLVDRLGAAIGEPVLTRVYVTELLFQ